MFMDFYLHDMMSKKKRQIENKASKTKKGRDDRLALSKEKKWQSITSY